jgi:hypothetical protein
MVASDGKYSGAADQRETNADLRATNADQRETNADQRETNADQRATNAVIAASQATTNAEQVVTNDEQHATNVDQQTTNDDQVVTNDAQVVTNDEQAVTNVEQGITNVQQHATNAEQHATNAENLIRMDASDVQRGTMSAAITEIASSLSSVITGQQEIAKLYSKVNSKSDARASMFRKLWYTLLILVVIFPTGLFALNGYYRNEACLARNQVSRDLDNLIQVNHDVRIETNPQDPIALSDQQFLDANSQVTCSWL